MQINSEPVMMQLILTEFNKITLTIVPIGWKPCRLRTRYVVALGGPTNSSNSKREFHILNPSNDISKARTFALNH